MNLFCNKHGITDFKIRPSGKRVCKKCEVYSSKKYRIKLKEKAVAYKGGACFKCGYNKSLRALDFHHRDPLEKDFAIGESRQGKKIVRNWEQLKPELDKCDLLCKNCHCEVHEIVDIDASENIYNYNVHRKDTNLINESLISGRKTEEQIVAEIESGKYYTETYRKVKINLKGKIEVIYFKSL